MAMFARARLVVVQPMPLLMQPLMLLLVVVAVAFLVGSVFRRRAVGIMPLIIRVITLIMMAMSAPVLRVVVQSVQALPPQLPLVAVAQQDRLHNV
jgi:hypothetical protein